MKIGEVCIFSSSDSNFATEPYMEKLTKKIGLLGGMSWVSSAEYYQDINRHTLNFTKNRAASDLILRSFDMVVIKGLLEKGNWSEIERLLLKEREILVNAGAEVIAVASNTIHNALTESVWRSGPPLIHIFDETMRAVRKNGYSKVGFIGTSYSLKGATYAPLINNQTDTECITPDISFWPHIDSIIFDELCRGKTSLDSSDFIYSLIEHMKVHGAEAVILGCTELREIVNSQSGTNLLDTTHIHSRAIAQASINTGQSHE